MKVRHATVADAPRICELVNYHAERERMLHRSLEEVYAHLRAFLVADDGGEVVGCAAVDIFWADLAEVRSLAVAAGRQGQRVGSKLLAAACDDARRVGVRRLFALTYEMKFFARHGFEVVDRDALPEKVWRACVTCPKADACDEVAMIMRL